MSMVRHRIPAFPCCLPAREGNIAECSVSTDRQGGGGHRLGGEGEGEGWSSRLGTHKSKCPGMVSRALSSLTGISTSSSCMKVKSNQMASAAIGGGTHSHAEYYAACQALLP